MLRINFVKIIILTKLFPGDFRLSYNNKPHCTRLRMMLMHTFLSNFSTITKTLLQWHRNPFEWISSSIHQPKIVRNNKEAGREKKFWFLFVLSSISALKTRSSKRNGCTDMQLVQETARVRIKGGGKTSGWKTETATHEYSMDGRLRNAEVITYRTSPPPLVRTLVKSRRSHDSRPRERDSGSRLDVSYLRRLPTQLN